MLRSSIRLLPLMPAVALAGCASLLPSEPERPDYLGADEVTTVEPGMVTGLWDVTVLNPVEDDPDKLSPVSFTEDGSYQGQFTVDEDDGMPADMTFRVTGRWSVSGENVVLSDGEIEAIDDTDDGLGEMVTGFINRYMRDTNATLNVYEAEDDHLVMVDEDGVAQRYDRVR